MFLTLPNTTVQAEMIWERINQGGVFGLENPVSHHFYDHKKSIKCLKNRLDKIDKNLEKDIKGFLKDTLKGFRQF